MGKVLKYILAITLFCLGFVACTTEEKSLPDAEHKTQIDEWHAKRIESLKSPTGWLNLAGLFWLKEGMNTFGSAEGNDLVFPREKIAPRAGYFMLKNGTVTLETDAASAIAVKGVPVTSFIAFHPDSAASAAPRMEHGSLLWFVIRRDDQYGIRLRDIESDGVRTFTGIERYPVDQQWRIKAKFENAEPGKTIDITNVLGQTTPNPSPGTLVFNIGDEEYRLDAIKEGGPDLFVIFGDPTNEKETYPSGRYIYVAPADSTGTTIIDFNKSYNPPCAFTPYATCPLPPRQNVLPVAITAGEKNYEGYDHQSKH
jgi:uncharacterized protein (DUF1684 family)